MKTWLAQIAGWPEADCIVSGDTRSKARIKVFLSAHEAGYQVRIGSIRVTRKPEFDDWVPTDARARCWDLKYVQQALAWQEENYRM